MEWGAEAACATGPRCPTPSAGDPGHLLGTSGYLCTAAPFRPDVALAFYDTLVRGDYDAARRAVARREDRWLGSPDTRR